jgi:dTDP-L-rhamnose 4-epimerase
MKKRKIGITGGLGFIGSHLADKLIADGHSVMILDNLDKQVHDQGNADYIPGKANVIFGSVLQRKRISEFVGNSDVIFHLASKVGVGQSNYQIYTYADVNVGGTALLLDSIIHAKKKPEKIILTASMTSYGEGMSLCETCGKVKPGIRPIGQLERGVWDVLCPLCGKPTIPLKTDEETVIENNSIYSLTKNTQEQMVKIIGTLYSIPVTVLRCFNVYGTRQSLSNPYTGVSAIFLSRLKNNHRPFVYEDGNQSRDFVSVHDVVRALKTCMEPGVADFEAINIGSGVSTSVAELARVLALLLKKDITPEVSNTFRKNDTRHCTADIRKAKKMLGWAPEVTLEHGLEEIIVWSQKQNARDNFEEAQAELLKNKLA